MLITCVDLTVPPARAAAAVGRRRRWATGLGLAVLAAASAGIERLPAAVIVPTMVVALSGIDVLGSIVAKSWAASASVWVFLTGAALFVLLFWIYGVSLRHGELTTVTVGWVVAVTLGDMLLDRFVYATHFPVSKWLATLAAVALLAYLLVSDSGEAPQPARSLDPPVTAPR